MMVYGHQSSAAEGAFFIQNYLASARHLPEEAPPQQFQGASAATSAEGDGGAGSGFLYSLLTAQDATAVQQCSAFLGGTEDQFPRRSQSVSVPARRGSAALPATSQPFAAAMGPLLGGNNRPSSAPRGLRGPCGGGSAPALSTEEPLDLSTMRVGGDSFIEQQQQQQQQLLFLQQQLQLQELQQQQPMLRNMLSQAAAAEYLQCQAQQPMQQPVQLAKKTVLVAQSHVADWLKKGTDLVRTNGALFGALDKTGKASLLCRAWPRILQLYMLEHNFQFAVSPAYDPSALLGDDCRRRPQATRKFAEDLQRMIGAATGVPFDNMTYNLLRLAAIFKADSMEEAHLIEIQEEIMKHVFRHLSMKGMQHYFKDAAALLEAVSQTDKQMLECLFCGHLISTSVDDFIRSQLG